MFDSLLDRLKSSICLHGGKPLAVPPSFEKCYSKTKDGVIRSWLWDVPGYRRWRITRMDAGEKIQVLNSVAYPEYLYDYPILGIDLLWFAQKEKLVAVLDFQPLVQDQKYFDKYFSGLKSLKKCFPDFSNSIAMHSYDNNNYFSPWVLFCRGGINEINSLHLIFDKFLEYYWDIPNNSSNDSLTMNPEKVRDLQIAYDVYSAERDPAHGLFKSYFGNQWSDSFLHDFLFSQSRDFIQKH